MFFLLGIMLDWRLTLYLKVEPLALLNLHHYISTTDHKMKEANLYRTYSMQQLLNRLDVLECFEDKGHKLRIGELMTKQADIYEALGATLPTSSC